MRVPAVVAGSAVGFASGWNIANTGAIADELAGAYGTTLAVIGLFTAGLFLVHLVMQMPSGRLCERLGAGRVCAVGLAVMVACNLVLLISSAEELGLGLRAVMGVGTAMGFIGGSDFVRSSGGSPLAQGLYGGLASAGGGAAIGVLPLLEPSLGWRAPYLTAIAVAVVGGIALAGCPWPARRGTGGQARPSMLTLARDVRLARLGAVFAASFGFSVVIGNWVVTLLEEETSLTSVAAGPIGALTLALPIISRPVGGWIMHNHPHRVGSAILASCVFGAAGTAALTLGDPWLALIGAILVGLCAGVPFATAFTNAARFQPGSPATAIGFVNSCGALTILVGSAALGFAFNAGHGVAAMLCVALLWLLSGFAARAVQRDAQAAAAARPAAA